MASRRCILGSSLCLLSAALVSLFLGHYTNYEGEEGLNPHDDPHPPIFAGHDGVVDNVTDIRKRAVYLERETTTEFPIVVWWTPFTGYTRIVHHCSVGSCLFTHSRTEYDNPLTAAFMFYGTQVDWTSLPLPRRQDDLWVLLHEESSKNNWPLVYDSVISLFNLTSTPSRYSSYPLVTQYLDSIERLLTPIRYSTEEKSAGGRGLVMYLQTDCDPPSDRDSYVSELMKYVKVDSYGKCLHNKDLPEHLRDPVSSMDAEELVGIISQYKFTLAMENAVCNDYITEKFWRPLYAGSVPIVKGSPTIKDWAPSDHSIILIDDYSSPEELAKYLLYLDRNDDEYERYLEFKKTGVTNSRLLEMMKNREWATKITSHSDKNMIEMFECFVCDTIHRRQSHSLPVDTALVANSSHYDCQFPVSTIEQTTYERRQETEFWRQVAKRAEYQANAIGPVIKAGHKQDMVTRVYETAADGMEPKDWQLPSS